MIAVIADDFTGAAEIGGIGLRHGLKVVIDAIVGERYDADLLVVAANTRALSERDAAERVRVIIEKILKLKPTLIFKKLDSVLRGNVGAELSAQMQAEDKQCAIVVAGNPFFKRAIKDGLYYIDGVLLENTSFANDPECKLASSNVIDIIGECHCDVKSVNAYEELPKSGILMGDIETVDDLNKWTDNCFFENMVLAGGAAFFDSILTRESKGKMAPNEQQYVFGRKALFIFGSAFPKLQYINDLLSQENVFVANMPDEIFDNEGFDESIFQCWVDEVVAQIESNKTVFVSISHQFKQDFNLSLRLSYVLGELTARVLSLIELDDLFIEGGTTALSVFEKLDIRSLIPFRELDPGVIQMKVQRFPDMCVTTKPGSYQWGKNRMKLSIC